MKKKGGFTNMKLYHISYLPISEFRPKIPMHRLNSEDITTPRICLSSSIISCLNAKAGKNEYIRLSLHDNIPCLIYVYTFECTPRDLLYPSDVIKRGVPDAELNQEFWLLHSPNQVQEKVFKVLSAKLVYDWRISEIELTEQISDADRLFVRFVTQYNEEAEKDLPAEPKYMSPEILFPQIWDDMVQLYRKKIR